MTEQAYAPQQPVAQPQPRVNLDLDSLERTDAAAGLEPFGFNHAGRVIQLTDPQDLDWQVVAYAAENPAVLIDAALSQKDRRFIGENIIPLWKMEKVVNAYRAYYDLPDAEGNAG